MSRTNRSDLFSRILLAGLLLLGFAGLHAQNPAVLSTVSPYSRFGIGDVQFAGSSINAGMGGGGIGMRNDSLIPQYFNFQNPASVTSHGIVAYEIALQSNTVQLQNASSKTTFNRTTLGNFAMAFPVTKWWGAGFGLVPYSSVGYNISTSATLENIGPVTYKYEGSGGVNQVFITNGFRPFAGAPRHYLLSSKYEQLRLAGDTSAMRRKLRARNNLANISVGVNVTYLFGSLTNIRRDMFPDSMYTFNTKITRNTMFRDVYMNYGIQYTFRTPWALNPVYQGLPDSVIIHRQWMKNKFTYHNRTEVDTARLFVRKPGVRVTIGAVFSLPTDINVSYSLLAQTYKQSGTLEQFRDTIINNDGIPARVTLPAMGGLGIALKKDYKWMFQADYMLQMWSTASILGQDAGLTNAQRITAGFQYQPRLIGRGNYLGVTQYRLGVRYYQTALQLRNTQLTEMAVNFSMSLPAPYHSRLGEPIGRANLSFEYGIRGTTSNSLVREDFMRITVGFTINDRWFQHYKYD